MHFFLHIIHILCMINEFLSIEFISHEKYSNITCNDSWEDATSSCSTSGSDLRLCEQLNITSIPSNITVLPTNFLSCYHINKLIINNAHIQNLSVGAFTSKSKIYYSSIDLSHNRINIIKNGVFSNIPLRFLFLSFNKINRIEAQVFNELEFLYVLKLDNNELEYLDDNLFLSLHSVWEIDLSNNKLIAISLCTIGAINNPQMTRFFLTYDISKNPIRNILKCAKNYKKFYYREIILVISAIPDFNVTLLSNLTQISYFNKATGNKIREINGICILDLSHNSLKILKNESFEEADRLKHLNLEFNNISKIESGVFKNMRSLYNLTLANNKLKSISFDIFENTQSLRYLDLSCNLIVSITLTEHHWSFILALEHLTSLKLSSNRLMFIDDEIKKLFSRVEILYLDNNHFQLGHFFKFFDRHKLRIISLDKNNWQCWILEKIVNVFLEKNVSIIHGESSSINNVLGIECHENINGTWQMEKKLLNFRRNFVDSFKLLVNESSNETQKEIVLIHNGILTALTIGVYLLGVLLIVTACLMMFQYFYLKESNDYTEVN